MPAGKFAKVWSLGKNDLYLFVIFNKQMFNKVDFKVGDIVYGKVDYLSGCSYHYVFGVITNITKTGKYRMHYLDTISGESKKTQFASWKDVKPNVVRKTGESKLLNTDGSYNLNRNCGIFFEKYDQSMELRDYVDFGD